MSSESLVDRFGQHGIVECFRAESLFFPEHLIDFPAVFLVEHFLHYCLFAVGLVDVVVKILKVTAGLEVGAVNEEASPLLDSTMQVVEL